MCLEAPIDRILYDVLSKPDSLACTLRLLRLACRASEGISIQEVMTETLKLNVRAEEGGFLAEWADLVRMAAQIEASTFAWLVVQFSACMHPRPPTDIN